jgi:YHS domain-containing protein
MNKILAVIALCSTTSLFAQTENTHDHAKITVSMKQKPSKQSEPLKEDGIDPVCKMRVKKGCTITTDHKGKQYGFCAEYCKEKFEEKPEKFVKN